MPKDDSLPEPIKPGWCDLKDVARIQLASFRRDLAYKRWMLIIFWLLPGVTFLVTRENGTVTGCIISDIHRGKIRIMNIAVDPAYRHKGLGKLLMTTVMNQNPDRSVALMVQEHNAAAQRLYEELGFKRTGFHPSYYGRGNPGIEMTLHRS